MSKQTAVEWLVEQLSKNHGIKSELYNEFEQAKEMEKQQIMKAFLDGSYGNTLVTKKLAEQYYNETFKTTT